MNIFDYLYNHVFNYNIVITFDGSVFSNTGYSD